MVQLDKKRAMEGKSLTRKARKRQRVEAPSNGLPTGGDFVRLDELDWQSVPLPDKLEDAEGFFGLEEIDDVDIIREGGRIQYKVLNKKKRKTKESIPAKSDVNLDTAEPDQGEDEGGEWEGFGEDEESPTEVKLDNALTKGTVKESKKDKKEKKKAKRNQNGPHSAETPVSAAGIFAALEAEAMEDETDVSAWKDLGLSPETLSSLARLKFTKPTLIQSAAIPEILAGRDVIGKASTGSGKTLAFGIPILEHYLDARAEGTRQQGASSDEEERDPPVALIVSPTRELAHQLAEHLRALCSSPTFEGPSIATVTGGLSLQKQQRQLKTADVIVGTPGRLWEVISSGHGLVEWLKKVKFLVVDEADRLLSQGHFKELEQILDALDREEDEASEDVSEEEEEEEVERQTLVFSATFHKGLQQKLTGKARSGGDLMTQGESMEYLLKRLNFREEKPKFIDVNPVSQMAEGLKEGLVECGPLEKDLYLYSLLVYYPNTRTLIFTNSISSVRRLTPFLQNLNLPALALHSQMPQKARLRSVERFSDAKQKGSILIATDVAARGLDIRGVELIVHYHLPRTADMYVHRSGRTARAENSGSSVLLCAPEEVVGVRRLVAKVHADAEGSKSSSTYYMRSLDLDRRVVARLKPRVTLAKKIADAALAKERKSHEDDWLRNAAEELGVDYDSEEFEAEAGTRKGRGGGKKKAEIQARSLTKGELGALRGELKGLLAQRVNVGVSERYLTSGRVDLQELLEGRRDGEFLGRVDSLDFEK